MMFIPESDQFYAGKPYCSKPVEIPNLFSVINLHFGMIILVHDTDLCQRVDPLQNIPPHLLLSPQLDLLCKLSGV